jgi:hypothetical protein
MAVTYSGPGIAEEKIEGRLLSVGANSIELEQKIVDEATNTTQSLKVKVEKVMPANKTVEEKKNYKKNLAKQQEREAMGIDKLRITLVRSVNGQAVRNTVIEQRTSLKQDEEVNVAGEKLKFSELIQARKAAEEAAAGAEAAAGDAAAEVAAGVETPAAAEAAAQTAAN